MSDWTDNPFADPNNEPETSPFDDPSITNVTQLRTTTDNQAYVAPAHVLTPTPVRSTSPQQSTLSSSSNPFSPSTSRYNQQQGSMMQEDDGAFVDKEQILQEKERELQAKQAALDERERQLTNAGIVGTRAANWPRFPDGCIPPFRPWIFHSITTDIPMDNQEMMVNVYNLWKYHCLCYFLNFVGALALLGCSDCSSKVSGLVFSIIYMVVGIPASFTLWYRQLYNGFKKDKSVSFMIFFFVFGFQFLANIYFTLGLTETGASGWITAFKVFGSSKIIFFFVLIPSVAWTVSLGAVAFNAVKVHRWYAGTDYTIERAQGEVVTDASNNETIRSGVKDSILNNMFA